MAIPRTNGYSRFQIALHWMVAALVVFQIIGHETILRTVDAFEKNALPDATDALFANLHVVAGMLIFLFAVWRIYLLVTRGAPDLPENEHPALKIVAKATHGILYLLLLGMPVSGAVAWFGGVDAAAFAHGTAKYVLMPLVLVHVLGALAHHFVLKTDVLRRMVKPET